MMINKIKLMSDCCVFHEFSWPIDLPEFGRYNLIYGWNGSGKTTLSCIFRTLENPAKPTDGHVTLTINGRNVSSNDFNQLTLPIRVFNRDFRDEVVFPKEGEVAPILNNNNYNKGDFSQRAEKMVSAGDKTSYIINDEARDKLLTQLRSNPKAKIQTIDHRLPDLKTCKKIVSELLSKTVVSSVIQTLKDDAQLSSWVHTGLGLHQERKIEKCLFCDQAIPKDRISALVAHFSTEYSDLMRKLVVQIDALQTAIKTTEDLAIPNAAEFYDDIKSDYESTSKALRKENNSAKRVLGELVKALEEKKNRAFDPIALDITIPDLNVDAVKNLNNIILKHNQACDDFQSRINAARKQLEEELVASNLDEFISLQDAIKFVEAGVSKTKKEIQRVSDEIAKVERDIVEHRRPAEELNEDLRKYLGHDELQLEIEKTGYKIIRHEKPAEGISEGEMTAIALLYFLKSLQDRRFDLEKGVVVLDDPVSSLDANALYYAFGFICEHTSNAKQLFILTHNFTFFQQVRNWFHHLKGQNKRDTNQRPARFYMVDCVHDGRRRCSKLIALDPLLEQYDSEHHYLFARIYRKVKDSSQGAFEEYYVFPNMARRVLEAFLAFRHPQIAGELWEKLRLVQFDESKKTRILRFVHTHSHSGAVGEPEHDPSILCETNSVLKDLLDFIQAQDPEHFLAMEQLITNANNGEV